MNNTQRPTCRPVRSVCIAAAAMLAMGSAALAEPFTFHPIDEIPEGQGLITDKSGVFTIFKWSRTRGNENEPRETSQPAPAPAQPITSTSGITEAPTPE